tara:strand:+ start:7765 stop:8133 length:369 start_codon:yes stop_codon:yes gene_type:complete
VRGLPGSGKSAVAAELVSDCGEMYAADDYFEKSGEYIFDPARLPEAHEECRNNVERAMEAKCPKIAIHNTFSKRWEAEPYFALAEKYGYSMSIIECQSNYGNVHGVPDSTVLNMIERWEPLL